MSKFLKWTLDRLSNTRFTLPSKRATDGSFSARCEAKLSVCMKHFTCNIPASCAAMVMFDTLSVTMAGSYPFMSHSSSAVFSNCTMWLLVWLSCIGRVCKTCETSSLSSEMWCDVIVTYDSVALDVHPWHVRATLCKRCSSPLHKSWTSWGRWKLVGGTIQCSLPWVHRFRLRLQCRQFICGVIPQVGCVSRI